MSILFVLSAVAAHGAEPPHEVAAFEGAHAQRPSFDHACKRVAVEANDHEDRTVALHVGPIRGPLKPVRPPSRGGSSLTSGFSTASQTPVVHEIAWPPAGFGDAFLYVAADSSKDFDLVLHGAGPIAAAPGADGGPAWSPDGAHIAFTSARTGEGDLYLLEAASLEKPPRQLTSVRTASELYPAWSPDGSKLVWVGHSDTGDNLYLLPDLAARPTKLTDWPGNQVRPTFSPTSDAVAFYANHTDPQRFDLYVVDAAPGSTPRLVLEGVLPDNAGPSWTPDGTSLIAVLDDDDALDPVVRVPSTGGGHAVLDLGTVGNADIAVCRSHGTTRIAWVAQGRTGDAVRDYRRLFLAEL